jgi:hypothetical protein
MSWVFVICFERIRLPSFLMQTPPDMFASEYQPALEADVSVSAIWVRYQTPRSKFASKVMSDGIGHLFG